MKYFWCAVSAGVLLVSSACMQSPASLIASGNRYHDKKKYKEAAILYQKAIAKDKTNAEAYYRAGLNLLDDGNVAEASKFLRRAIDLKPSNTDAEVKLSEIYLGAFATNPQRFKNFLVDIKDLDSKILANDPNSFDGMRIQGMVNLAENNRQKALECFEKANTIKPHSTELVGWYAETLNAAGRQADAERLVREALAANPKWGQGYDLLFLMYSRANDKAKAEAILKERADRDSTNPIAIQNYANYLLVSGRAEEGEAVIKRVLADKKAFPAGHQQVGDYYLRAKRWDDALAQYQAGTKDDSKNAIAYRQRMITAYEAMGKKDEAFQLAKSLAKDNPKNELANESYASLLLRSTNRSDLSKTTEELRHMVSNLPTAGLLHFQLAQAYFLQDQRDKALTEALDGISNELKNKPMRPAVVTGSRNLAARIYEDRGDHAKAIDQTEIVLTTDARNPDARFTHSRALIGINQVGRAQTDLEGLLQELPQFNDARLTLAAIYLSQKDFDKAAAEFEKVSKASPDDPRGILGLQNVKLAQGKGEEAVAAVQNLVEKNPNIPAYRQELAVFQATAGEQLLRAHNETKANKFFEQAADSYREVLKLQPASADNWLRLGALQRQLSQNEQALTSFEEASKHNPRDMNAMLNRAMLLETLNRKKDAADLYSKVLGLDPENALALNNMAFMNAERGENLDQAMTFAERAKKRVPNSPDISDTLGYVYLQKNLNSEALRIFKQLVQQAPNNPTYRFHLAMALLKQGDRQGARDQAQKALDGSQTPDQQNKIKSFVSQIG